MKSIYLSLLIGCVGVVGSGCNAMPPVQLPFCSMVDNAGRSFTLKCVKYIYRSKDGVEAIVEVPVK